MRERVSEEEEKEKKEEHRSMLTDCLTRIPLQLIMPCTTEVSFLDQDTVEAQRKKVKKDDSADSLCLIISTPMLQDFLGDDKPKRFRREVHFPTGRFGEAIEQAQAVIFLASDESSFVNATDFVVDGGLTKAYVTPEGPATAAPQNLGH